MPSNNSAACEPSGRPRPVERPHVDPVVGEVDVGQPVEITPAGATMQQVPGDHVSVVRGQHAERGRGQQEFNLVASRIVN